MINVALSELDKTDGTKYGGGSGEAWCAYFTTWVLKNTKMDDGNSIYSYLRTFGSIDDGAASGLWPAFRNGKEGVSFNKSKAYGGNYTPKRAMLFGFNGLLVWLAVIVEKSMVNGMVVHNVLIMLE